MKKKLLILLAILTLIIVGGYFYTVKMTADNLKTALETYLLPLKNSPDKNNKINYAAINSGGFSIYPKVEIEKFSFNLKDENNLEAMWQDDGKLIISINYFTHSLQINSEGSAQGSFKNSAASSATEFKSQAEKPFSCQSTINKSVIFDILMGKSAEIFADSSGFTKAIEKTNCAVENYKIVDNKTQKELASIAKTNMEIAINRQDDLITGSSAKIQIADNKLSDEFCTALNPHGSSIVCAEKTAGAHNFSLNYVLTDLGKNNNTGQLKGNVDYSNKLSKLAATIDGKATSDTLDFKTHSKMNITPEAVAMQRADIVKMSTAGVENIEKKRGAKLSDAERAALLTKIQHNVVEPLVELHDFEMDVDLSINGLTKKGPDSALDIRNFNILVNDNGIKLAGKGNPLKGDFNLQCINCEKTVRGSLSIAQGFMEISALEKASQENPSLSSETIDKLVHIVQSVGEPDAKDAANLNIHVHNNTPDQQWIIGKLQVNQVMALLMAAQASTQTSVTVTTGEATAPATPVAPEPENKKPAVEKPIIKNEKK